MTQHTWPPDAVVASARRRLVADGAVTEGFRGQDVREDHGSLLVVFRWFRDPNTYAVRFPLTHESPWMPELPTPESVDGWVDDVAGWLMEELDTGWVRRARRSHLGGLVELDRDEARGSDVPRRYDIEAVPPDSLVEEWLAEAGMDVTLARQLRSEGRLLTWIKVSDSVARAGSRSSFSIAAFGDEPPPMSKRKLLWARLTAQLRGTWGHNTPVGHAVVSRDRRSEEAAILELLEVTSEAPAAVRHSLVLHAVHDAAEAGCLRISTTIDDPVLARVGFRPSSTGAGFILDTTAINS